MTGERMFPFITRTWNPIAGGFEYEENKLAACSYLCDYCWARDLINRHRWEKYQGRIRIHEPEMKVNFKPEDFVFVCDMTDIGNPNVPRDVIIKVLNRIAEFPDTQFLLLTKNPYFYIVWNDRIPENCVLGATIESDDDVVTGYSYAPGPMHRIQCMQAIANKLPHKRFVCVEPIMKMSPYFERELLKIRLTPPNIGVAVGYDNYDHKLPEPHLERTKLLIEELEANGVTVYRKTIRRAWDE